MALAYFTIASSPSPQNVVASSPSGSELVAHVLYDKTYESTCTLYSLYIFEVSLALGCEVTPVTPY